MKKLYNRERGIEGEEHAESFLSNRGYQMISRNVRTPYGEIDLLAVDTATEELVFVEVKLRRSSRFGTPQEAVNYRKMRHITKAAMHILAHTSTPRTKGWRIDVIAIQLERHDITIEHFTHAGFG